MSENNTTQSTEQEQPKQACCRGKSDREKRVERAVVFTGAAMIGIGTFALGYLIGRAVGES